MILTAGARGDFAERDRLSGASRSLALTMRDFVPWAQAFTEVAMLIFMELVEAAAKQNDAFERYDAFRKLRGRTPTEEETGGDEPADPVASSELSEDDGFETQLFDTILANGFILKTKIEGWTLFCERLNVPPLAIWQALPGYARFEAAMKLVEGSRISARRCLSAGRDAPVLEGRPSCRPARGDRRRVYYGRKGRQRVG